LNAIGFSSLSINESKKLSHKEESAPGDFLSIFRRSVDHQPDTEIFYDRADTVNQIVNPKASTLLRALRISNMIIQITVEGRKIMFRLDWKQRRWHSLDAPQEADFPLITLVDGKRYELYSDGTFDEVEK
jgi:hypothetical protein